MKMPRYIVHRADVLEDGVTVTLTDVTDSVIVSEEEERAEWVKVDKSGLRCSKCGSIFRHRGGTRIPKHCPECGTKTIGVE